MNIDRKTFTQALTAMSKVIDPRQTIPVLACVKLDPGTGMLEMTGTDLEVSMILGLEPLSADPEDQAVAVDIKKLLKAVKALPRAVTALALQLRTDHVVVSGTKITSLQPAADFPTVAVKTEATAISGLIEGLKKVTPALSHDETRYALNGALLDFDNGAVVGSDWHRMHVATMATAALNAVIIPRKAVAALTMPSVKAQDAVAFVNEGLVSIPVAGGHLTARLIEGQFPNWQAVMPKDQPITLTVQRVPFIELLSQAKATANDRNFPVLLVLANDRVEIDARSEDTSTTIPVPCGSYKGGDLQIGFNAKYAIEALELVTGLTIVSGEGAGEETVRLTFKDGLSPLVIHGVDGFTAVIMPMRLDGRPKA